MEYVLPTLPDLVEEDDYHFPRRANDRSRHCSSSSGNTMPRGRSAKLRAQGTTVGYPKTQIGDNMEKGSSPSEKGLRNCDNLTEIQKGGGGKDSLHAGVEGPVDRFFLMT